MTMKTTIFQFFDGTQDAHVDPAPVNRAFTRALDGDPKAIFQLTKSENPDIAFPAIERIIGAARDAFGLPAIDRATGNGVPDHVVLAIVRDFYEFIQKKNLTPDCSQISPAPTESAPLAA